MYVLHSTVFATRGVGSSKENCRTARLRLCLCVPRAEKKQLIVSRTLSTERRGWEEFNVESAVSQWYRSRGKNHGLDIELQDALGNKLVPGLYFQNMSCTETAGEDRFRAHPWGLQSLKIIVRSFQRPVQE